MIDRVSGFMAFLLMFALVCGPTASAQANRGQAPEKAAPGAAGYSGGQKTYEPSDHYQVRQIEGWSVHVNKAFLAKHSELAKETLALLRRQLGQIERRVPPEAVKKLRTIHFWVEENEPHHPCMAYHPDPDWLREHGMNPDKARCVELSNARNFLKWTREQPWMALHELSHGYHHQFLKGGFANAEITTAFNNAMKSNRYDSVLRSNGKKEKAYAATNPMEYFAEASEAYFGANDFYPVNSGDLERHDPEMFALVKRLWRGG
jgi:hypothetical protein